MICMYQQHSTASSAAPSVWRDQIALRLMLFFLWLRELCSVCSTAYRCYNIDPLFFAKKCVIRCDYFPKLIGKFQTISDHLRSTFGFRMSVFLLKFLVTESSRREISCLFEGVHPSKGACVCWSDFECLRSLYPSIHSPFAGRLT